MKAMKTANRTRRERERQRERDRESGGARCGCKLRPNARWLVLPAHVPIRLSDFTGKVGVGGPHGGRGGN